MSDTSSPPAHSTFDLKEAHAAIRDLFQPRPWIYWADFISTYLVGVFCFQQVRGGSLLAAHQGFRGTFSQVAYFCAACLLFYRASMFIHEVVHQRTNPRMRSFRFVWNVLCGIPFLIPSFVYLTHIDHHRRDHFGTDRDGEYIPLERSSLSTMLLFVAGSLVVPILAIIRFLVLTPMAWVIPGLRDVVHRHASSMVMDPSYIRPSPTPQALRVIRIQEFACLLWCLAIAVVSPLFLGRWPIAFLIHAYLTAVCIVTLNALRTLGAHRWHNNGGEMSFVDQVLDSVNYPNRPFLSELWGPVGTRFHPLHHLFPSLPYHALPEAHRRLTQALPSHSPYRMTVQTSLISSIWDLFRRNRAHRLNNVLRGIPSTSRDAGASTTSAQKR